MMPKTVKKNTRNSMEFNMSGNVLRITLTRSFILGILFIVLIGLKILKILSFFS
jgi:hypothetical protein